MRRINLFPNGPTMNNTNDNTTGKRQTGHFISEITTDADGYFDVSVYRVESHQDADGYWFDVGVYVGGGLFDSYDDADACESALRA